MLKLTPIQQSDGEKIYFGWSSFNQNFKFLNLGFHKNINEANTFITEFLSNPSNIGYHITLNDIVIGFCRATVKDQQAHIGYIINLTHRGNGYATTATKELLRILNKKNINAFYATCHQDNTASHAVVKKLEFSHTNTKHNHYIFSKQKI